jgi:hypothetical protein
MSFFIFTKNFDNISGSFLYRIAENQDDLNNLNINQSDYKIIEDSQENFNAVKYGTKIINKYNNNEIFYNNQTPKFLNKEKLQEHIYGLCTPINDFLYSNKNHSQYNQWNNYKNQLDSLNLNNVEYPLNKSLEQYFNDLGQPSYNILQLP